MLIYRGGDMEHWREAYTGKDYCQAFLHYNNAKTPKGADNIYDGRPHLGLPKNFRQNWYLNGTKIQVAGFYCQ